MAENRISLTTQVLLGMVIALLMAVDGLRDMVSTWGNVVIHSLGTCTVHRVIRGSAALSVSESA